VICGSFAALSCDPRFPNHTLGTWVFGHTSRSRWLWVVYLYVAVALGEVLAMLFLPGTLEGLDLIENPLGIEGLPIGRKPVQALIFSGGLIASSTLIWRLRRGAG
jgi:hypothetical protein